jgi:hypothetical protein
MITSQRDCQNNEAIKTITFQDKLPNYNYADDLSQKLRIALIENHYQVVTSRQTADFQVTLAPAESFALWDKHQKISGYGIYSKEITMGYLNYQLTIEDVKTQQISQVNTDLLSITLPDSKLLPKYAQCPIMAIGMPHEDLEALIYWLRNESIPVIQAAVVTGLESSEMPLHD